MITYGFEFFRPSTLAETLDLLAEHGESARVMAGGMSLMPIMNLGLATPDVLVSLNHVGELAYVRAEGGVLRIGATTRHAAVLSSPEVAAACPALATAASHIGDVQVRNRGTIGGSVAHADSAADYLPVLAAAGATAVVQDPGGRREVGFGELFVGIMETQLAPGELITEIRVPEAPAGTSAGYVRLARVEGSFAIANAAVVAGPSGAALALGGVRPTPVLVATSGAGTASAGDLEEWARRAATEALADGARDNEESRYKDAMAVVCAGRAAREALGAGAPA
jgi:carbon-monoxide dehydrogenase medium subunit